MPNEIITKITFDTPEIAELVERFVKDRLTDEEEQKYYPHGEPINDECSFLVEACTYLRRFDDFGFPTNFYRKDNCIWTCTAWHPFYKLAKTFNRLLNVHVIAEIDEERSESCNDEPFKEYNFWTYEELFDTN